MDLGSYRSLTTTKGPQLHMSEEVALNKSVQIPPHINAFNSHLCYTTTLFHNAHAEHKPTMLSTLRLSAHTPAGGAVSRSAAASAAKPRLLVPVAGLHGSALSTRGVPANRPARQRTARAVRAEAAAPRGRPAETPITLKTPLAAAAAPSERKTGPIRELFSRIVKGAAVAAVAVVLVSLGA